MNYTKQEVIQYVAEDDVKFIRLGFCDIFGVQKNIAIQPAELERAFEQGIPIDASAIAGFEDEVSSDIFLKPDPSTLCGLPWRPENGKVVRMFCSLCRPDGSVLEADSRNILRKAVEKAEKAGLFFNTGSRMEFYVFKTNDDGEPTKIPYDNAGYMDIAPLDKGENVRREICLTLAQMGIAPESSHHEEGPGQNEIDFKHSDPLTAADNAVTFKSVVEIIAGRNGLSADFSPKPIENGPGSGFHISFSVNGRASENQLGPVVAGIMNKIQDMTLFLNPTKESYERLGKRKAPGYVSWTRENRPQLIRIPEDPDGYQKAILRSADCMANPYLAFALLIEAGLYGCENKMELEPSTDDELLSAPEALLCRLKKLPQSLSEAKETAKQSDFIKECLPASVLKAYFNI